MYLNVDVRHSRAILQFLLSLCQSFILTVFQYGIKSCFHKVTDRFQMSKLYDITQRESSKFICSKPIAGLMLIYTGKE